MKQSVQSTLPPEDFLSGNDQLTEVDYTIPGESEEPSEEQLLDSLKFTNLKNQKYLHFEEREERWIYNARDEFASLIAIMLLLQTGAVYYILWRVIQDNNMTAIKGLTIILPATLGQSYLIIKVVYDYLFTQRKRDYK